MRLEVEPLLASLQHGLERAIRARGIERPIMVGIHTGGAWLAERLHARLALEDSLGSLDISFYRDDFSRIGLHPKVKPSQLPLSLDARHILLIDDVLFTGRTIRAALNELFDYGRPASVSLGVLVERNGRELPIEADALGRSLTLERDEHVELSGPEPLELSIVDRVDSLPDKSAG